MEFGDLLKIIADKKVLFITPSDVEYIRNKQEIYFLRGAAKSLNIVGPENTHSVKPTGIKRILQILLKAVSADVKNYDIVFVAGIPQAIVPLMRFLFRKQILIIDFFISVYDTLVSDRKVFSPGNPISCILKALDRTTLSSADYVIVDTKAHARYFSEMFAVDPGKMTVLYLEPDKDIYYYRKVERPEDLKDKFIAFFFGAMNPLQGIEIILDSARIIKKHDHIRFLIIGPHEKIANFGRYSELTNVSFVARWLPQNEIANYIAMSDVCLAGHFSAAIPKASRVIPGKAYSYLAMDKPVIFGDNPANRELFSEANKNVHFVEMGKPASLGKLILELAGKKRLIDG